MSVYQTSTSKANVCFVVVPRDARRFELSLWNYQKQEWGDTLTLIFESKEHEQKFGIADRHHVLLGLSKNFHLFCPLSEVT